MPNIRPVSDLRNYAEVLKEISFDEPVFLTKNGRGRYAIVDMEEYEKTKLWKKSLRNWNTLPFVWERNAVPLKSLKKTMRTPIRSRIQKRI